jgi:double-stranded uracil-DNA glycosylase
MERVPDVLRDRPAILFVGINPGSTSGKVGHHFAGPGNPFWKLLHAAKLTPMELTAVEDGRLAELGHALTNICSRTTKTAAELTRGELAAGTKKLLEKIERIRPNVVALVGITLYPLVCGTAAAKANPGPGAKPERLAGARLFVVPNPSGLNASFPSFAAKLEWFEALRSFAHGRGSGKPSATSM